MRHTVHVTAAVAALLLLGGCTANNSSGASTDSAPEQIAPAPADGSVSSDAGGAEESAADTDTSREVIARGSLFVTVADPLEAAAEAVRIVEGAGGRIDTRSERPAVEGSGGSAAADLTVRIPSTALTATIDGLKALGELEDYQLTEDDVTAQSRDLDARISALRTSTGRLEALLATAATTQNLIDIENALSQRQSELEGLEAQSRTLADQVDLATVTVSFGSEATAPVDRPQNFFSGIATGWEALVGFTGAILVGIGVLLPWLIVPALLALGLLIVLRSRRRRAAPSGPATTETNPLPVEKPQAVAATIEE